jgi:hypothetical protein
MPPEFGEFSTFGKYHVVYQTTYNPPSDEEIKKSFSAFEILKTTGVKIDINKISLEDIQYIEKYSHEFQYLHKDQEEYSYRMMYITQRILDAPLNYQECMRNAYHLCQLQQKMNEIM